MNKERETRERNGNMGEMQNGAALLEQIRALSFVKVELELFLDTHPDCRTALDYYHQTVEALDALITKYHNTVAPLVATGAVNEDNWSWVNEPWPWQMSENGKNNWGGK